MTMRSRYLAALRGAAAQTGKATAQHRMRKPAVGGVLVGLATLVAGMLAAAASAAPGASVAFVVNNQFGGPETIVVSSIPGCSTGTVTTSPEAAYAGPMGLFSGTKLFDCGASGTFTLAYKAHALACSPTDSGTWQIVDGTGMYTGMTGQGLVTGTYYGPDPCVHAGILDSYAGTLRLAGS